MASIEVGLLTSIDVGLNQRGLPMTLTLVGLIIFQQDMIDLLFTKADYRLNTEKQ